MSSQALPAVKICGITKVTQAQEIASIGANAIGVIGVKNSKRYLPEIERRKLFFDLSISHPETERVWVIANLETNEISSGINHSGSPTVVQLHGNEPKHLCEELKAIHPKIKFWKSIQVRGPEDLVLAKNYEKSVDAILLDAWSSNSLGGTGKRIPIEWLKHVNFKVPWWLAGGISSDCLEEILSNINPFGIDASSKLEANPGIKDIRKVELLINQINSYTKII